MAALWRRLMIHLLDFSARRVGAIWEIPWDGSTELECPRCHQRVAGQWMVESGTNVLAHSGCDFVGPETNDEQRRKNRLQLDADARRLALYVREHGHLPGTISKAD